MSSPKVSTEAPRQTAANDRVEALAQRLKDLEKYLGVGGDAKEFHGTLDDWNRRVRDAIQDLQQRAGVPANQTIDPPDAEHIVPPPTPPFLVD